METIQKDINFKLKKSLTPDQFQKVKIKLDSQSGVINVVHQSNLIYVTYEPYKVSDEYLSTSAIFIKDAGIIPNNINTGFQKIILYLKMKN